MAHGANVTSIPGLMMPVSTRPTGTVPIPEEKNKFILRQIFHPTFGEEQVMKGRHFIFF